MNVDEIKLLELLEADEEAGIVHFKGRRALIFDADAMGLLRKELVEDLGVDGARRVLGRFGYARGYRTAHIVRDLFEPEDRVAWWRAGVRFNMLQGFVALRPVRAEVDPERGVFDVEAEWANSYEAEQHLAHLGVADVPVCWTLAGYASGFTRAVLGLDVICVERECVGKGDARCYVVARAHSEKMDEEFERVAELYRRANFGAEIRELMRQLDERSSALAAEHERVRALESEVFTLHEAFKGAYDDEVIGTSPPFRRALAEAERVAASGATVLLTGETGTGKEVFARRIHTRSRRVDHALVVVNCAALPSGLVEAELFGHEKGAFTGAHQRKLGRFELAKGGTVFLDEIGELPLDVQAKFLRVLQRGEFERVGGTETLSTDARVIAATNQPLATLVAEGRFRADLFYRLNVFPIHLPPLRERPEDVVLLTNYFAQRFRARYRKQITSIAHESLERLKAYPWPGNVRELEHVVERAVLLSDGEVLTIDPAIGGALVDVPAERGPIPAAEFVTLDEAERRYVARVLRHTNGLVAGKGGAAEILGLPPSTLRSRMKRLGIR
jgi:transcriptional regulator with GAF, ATPase, and Fis domain/predicted hydrocarbon binding protein